METQDHNGKACERRRGHESGNGADCRAGGGRGSGEEGERWEPSAEWWRPACCGLLLVLIFLIDGLQADLKITFHL